MNLFYFTPDMLTYMYGIEPPYSKQTSPVPWSFRVYQGSTVVLSAELDVFFLVVSCAQCPNASTGQICESRFKLPVSCNAGEIPSSNGTVCIRCRPGYFCQTPQEGEQECAVGQYSLGGATECKDCLEGYECPNSGSLPRACALGHYANGKKFVACLQCQAGFKCPTATGNPVPCTAGMNIVRI